MRKTKLRVVGNFRPGYDGWCEELSQLLQNLPLVLPSTHPLSFAGIRAASSRRKSTRKRRGSLYTVLPPGASSRGYRRGISRTSFLSFLPPFVIPGFGIRSEMPGRCRSSARPCPVTSLRSCYDIQDKAEGDIEGINGKNVQGDLRLYFIYECRLSMRVRNVCYSCLSINIRSNSTNSIFTKYIFIRHKNF